MARWPVTLKRPEDVDATDGSDRSRTEPRLAEWFGDIARRLLSGTRLVVAGQAHRLTEVEFYYHCPAHPDPFTHRDPLQYTSGRWYFHRTRGVYRSGSFKGIDLTFGEPEASAGVLFRGLETPEGTLIDGPSLLVDHLLRQAGFKTVAGFDAAIGSRLGWARDNPLHLVDEEEDEERDIYTCPRVGLSLKRPGKSGEPERFVMCAYRFLSEPRRIAKGKPQIVLGRHVEGSSESDIHRLTGCPLRTVRRYTEDFESGRGERDFTPFRGRNLTPGDLCRLYGVWWTVFGDR
jgi:3-methyladenine DNA glycosylase Mpg